MATYRCPDCKTVYNVFGKDGTKAHCVVHLSAKYGTDCLPFLVEEGAPLKVYQDAGGYRICEHPLEKVEEPHKEKSCLN